MAETVGELRKRLSEQGEPWHVDPRLSDAEPLPNPPRGGQLGDEIPAEHRLVAMEPTVSVADLIGKTPPSNPFLLLAWVEAGILDREALPDVRPALDDGEHGA